MECLRPNGQGLKKLAGKSRAIRASQKASSKAEHLSYDKAVGPMVVFAEHYPLASVEQDLYAKLQLKEVPVLSCLEEPLFICLAVNELPK